MAEIEQVVFMNMCMLEDGKGHVLALDKESESYRGTTFPGGHVEPGETFYESMVREFFEETGLTVRNLEFRGIYHWMRNGVRNVGLMYKASEYSGELRSSSEGRVYWISEEEYLKRPLADGMAEVWRMMHEDPIQEVKQVRTESGHISIIPGDLFR